MITKTKAALAAALVFGSASTAFAVDVTANADRVVSSYYQQQVAPEAYARAQLFEGRNVGVQNEYPINRFQDQYPVNSDQQHWYERASTDFNS